MKCFILNVEKGTAEVANIAPKLEVYYALLNVRVIDITERKIGDFWYDIICDDEGLLKQFPIPSAFDSDGEPALVGNLIFCSSDDEGNETSLTDEKIKNLNAHLGMIVFGERLIPVMTGVDY